MTPPWANRVVRSAHTAIRRAICSSDRSASRPWALWLNTTTSQAPMPARVSAGPGSGWGAVRVRLGKRLANTAMSYVPRGSSVGCSGSLVGASGLYSGGGRKVRPSRCAAYMTHSPRRGCQRMTGRASTASGLGLGISDVTRMGARP